MTNTDTADTIATATASEMASLYVGVLRQSSTPYTIMVVEDTISIMADALEALVPGFNRVEFRDGIVSKARATLVSEADDHLRRLKAALELIPAPVEIYGDPDGED